MIVRDYHLSGFHLKRFIKSIGTLYITRTFRKIGANKITLRYDHF